MDPMPPARPWTADEDTDLQTRHAAGETLGSIAKGMSRSRSTIHKHAERLGLTWDRAATQAATQARVTDAKARRADLKAKLLEDAHRLRAQLWEPAHYVDHGGKDFIQVEWTRPTPVYTDQLKLMQATSTAIASYERLEKLDGDGGVADAVSMLDKIADAIRQAAEAQK